MAYIPQTNSVVAFQSDPTKLVGTVSVVGNMNSSVFISGGSLTQPGGSIMAVNMPSPSIIAMQLAGSVLAVSGNFSGGNSSVQLLGGVGVIGSVATLQGTNPWIVNVPTPSLISTQIAGSVLQTVSRQLAGSVLAVNMPSPSVVAMQLAGSIMAVSGTFTANPQSSITALQLAGSVLAVGGTLSVLGTVPVTQSTSPWVINMPSPSVIVMQLAGSIMAVSATVNTGNSSVQLLGGVAAIGSVAVLQGTNPWQVNVPTPSYITYQLAGSLLGVSGTFNGGNSSVQLLGGNAVIGSVTTLQGTNPWIVNMPSPSVIAMQLAGSIMAVSGSFSASPQSSINALQLAGSVLAVRTDNASVVAVLINSSVTTLQGTNPWIVNMPSSSYLSIQPGGSVLNVNVSGSVAAAIGNNSVFAIGTYAEDSAHTTGNNGLFILGVRNDTMSSITSADGDYSPMSQGPAGETIVSNSPITKWVSGATSVMYGTSVQVLAAPGASIFTYITGIQVANESANQSRVTITQGLGRVPASMVAWAIAPPGGGSNIIFNNPVRVLDNNGISASISGVSSVYVMIQGFTSKT